MHFRQLTFFLICIVGGGIKVHSTLRPPGDYDNGEIGGMIDRGNQSTRRKPAPMPLCPPQTPHAARTRTRAAAVGSQRLTAELRHGPLLLYIYIYLTPLSHEKFFPKPNLFCLAWQCLGGVCHIYHALTQSTT
jgi:hypothetical protein